MNLWHHQFWILKSKKENMNEEEIERLKEENNRLKKELAFSNTMLYRMSLPGLQSQHPKYQTPARTYVEPRANTWGEVGG